MAYFILRSLLFKPAVALVQKERAQRDELRDDIEHNHVLITKKMDKRQQLWQLCREVYINTKPVVDDSELFIFKRLHIPIEYPIISDDVVEQLITQTTDKLVKRVSNDYL